LIVALVVGAAAGFWSARVAPAQALAARGSEARSALRVRRVLVVIQVALAVSLVSSAGLLVASFTRLSAEETGVDVDLLTVAEASLPVWRYPLPARSVYPRWPEATRLYDRLLAELEQIPGARAVALALNHPLEAGWTSQVEIDDHEVAGAEREETWVRPVTPGYFAAVGLPIVAGRDLAPSDRGDAEEVVVVNRALARHYLPDVDPVGHTVRLWGSKKRIVGVVEDERFLGLERASEPAIYPPLHQLPMSDLALIARSDRSDLELGAALEKALRRVDPEMAAYNVQPLRRTLADSISAPRLRTTLFALFGTLTAALAAVGLYGVVASDVERRRRELGVRFALGAPTSTVLSSVLGRSLALAAAGTVVGLLGAFAAGRALAALLF
ncbi:MAG: ABC transporter permease, partial [Myxococcota bacterium]